VDVGRGHRQRRRRRSSRWPIEKEKWRKQTTTRTTKRKSSLLLRREAAWGALPRRMKASGFLRPSRLIETNIDNLLIISAKMSFLSLSFFFSSPLFPSSVLRIPFDDFYRCHFFNDRMFHPWLHLFFRFLRPSVSYRMLYFLLSHRCWKTLIKRKKIIQCTWLKRKPIISVRFFFVFLSYWVCIRIFFALSANTNALFLQEQLFKWNNLMIFDVSSKWRDFIFTFDILQQIRFHVVLKCFFFALNTRVLSMNI